MESIQKFRRALIVNKNRLLKEYSQTKETILLIKKSFTSKLTTEEKATVKEQLPDLIKIVIAFGIFMLPMGSIWLLLWIKFVPKMLPSAFQEKV